MEQRPLRAETVSLHRDRSSPPIPLGAFAKRRRAPRPPQLCPSSTQTNPLRPPPRPSARGVYRGCTQGDRPFPAARLCRMANSHQ